eukprot:7666506-Pyramimonas_sp.AAC.1
MAGPCGVFSSTLSDGHPWRNPRACIVHGLESRYEGACSLLGGFPVRPSSSRACACLVFIWPVERSQRRA